MCHFMCGSGEREEMVRMRNKLVFRLDILVEYIYYQTLVWSCYIGAKSHTHTHRVRENEKACFTKKN